MTLNDLGGKELVNLNNGERLGILADCDIIVDVKTGTLLTLLVPERKLQFSFFGQNEYQEISWESIKKIGNDMVIVEIEI